MDKKLLAVLLVEKEKRQSQNKIKKYYPDDGPLRRELYTKHLSFFAAGKEYRQRLMLAANRVGKTEGVGLYELVLHLTGDYPTWWDGRRFDKGVRAWAAGDTGKTVREILQSKLLGAPGEWGTGLLPAKSIERVARGAGVADSVEIVYVKHVSGSISQVVFKSYDQRRESFQGTEQDIILLDEEPPMAIYTECLLRTMTNNGMLMLTFTPLMGMSEVVLAFLPGGQLQENEENASKFVVMADWDSVPHLSDDVKKELWESIPPFQRDARSKGVPQLGAGAVYPVPESDFVMPDFELPKHWKRAYGMDVGWNRTAVVWGAVDPDTSTCYLYSEHYRGQAEPVVHAQAIKSRGEWMKGAIDPAARGRGQKDGDQLIEIYKELGLHVVKADNAVESGLYATWELLSGGKLKVFASLGNWLSEYRMYRRDESGKIVKANDHLMDATRYFIMTGREIASVEQIKKRVDNTRIKSGWMG